MEIEEVEKVHTSLSSTSLTIAVAVNGSKNSKNAVKWALEKFIPEGRISFKLLHVRPRITMVPTPMGNHLPVSQVRDDIVSAHKDEIEWKTDTLLLPYKRICSHKQVEAEAVVIEADDVAEAIAEEVSKFKIGKLVIGASSRNVMTRAIKGSGFSSRISRCTPTCCTVYVVSKGKLSSVRPSTSETNEGSMDGRSDSSSPNNSFSTHTSSAQSEWTDMGSSTNFSQFSSSSLLTQRHQALANVNQNLTNSIGSNPIDVHHSGHISLSTEEDIASSSSSVSDMHYVSQATSYKSFKTDGLSMNSTDQDDVTFELDKLRIELQHFRRMYEMAQNETTDASQQLNELSTRHMEEAAKLREISLREEKARELVIREKEKREAAQKEVVAVREYVEREISQRKDLEYNAAHDAEEKRRLENSLKHHNQQCKEFTFDEILSATSSFSHELKIGMGANGTVYKGTFHHMTVAVKVLNSKEDHRTKQFKQELELLGRIRHPHLLLLIGACPDHSCLVYEYMENGSLDDRLRQKDNSPPLRWFERFRIAWEVSSALAFLHNSETRPIVHRDLKPANILLDNNFVSKIGDVGLSTLVPSVDTLMSTIYKDTAPVGTFCYIDPEYQRTGLLSPKSDVYALGMVILQLLTAKSPMGLTHIVEMALENNCLKDVLDSKAGKWPYEETKELALMGLNCAELRRQDRPDLKRQVLPLLERLRGIADEAHDCAPDIQSLPPSHYICPILKEVMDDPCVASDGYTYDRKAIETWFRMNDKSPMTNLYLPSKALIPNRTLLSAIREWKSANP
ncbi:U-box domain-containing protein 52 [Acorus calamus]|uniref:RING-type E3 ubiquitin transferase n=1 Tax=Acorus calamus TaxID=4465 RepID=A0AAV9E1L0_ACOCL|nr:U-box domain-containing protein 52 [Acorus calamus]